MKTGLDYFPLDVDWLADDKLTLLQADYGNRGIGILIRLLGEIYRHGYFLPWGEREQKRFAMRCFEPIPEVLDMVEMLIEEGFFDKRLATGPDPVLTSAGIQRRWIFAASRRQIKTIQPSHNLLAKEDKLSAKGDGERDRLHAIKKDERSELQATDPGESGAMYAKREKMSAKRLSERDGLFAFDTTERGELLTFDAQRKGKYRKVNHNSPPQSPPSQGVIFPKNLDTPEHRSAWDRFLAHRRSMKRPYRSAESQNAQLKRFEHQPDAFIAAIDNAIANSWQGLHIPKDEKKNSTPSILAKTERSLDVAAQYEKLEAHDV